MRRSAEAHRHDLWHSVAMRLLRCSLVLIAALASSACFELSTTVRVKGDGSGTIQQRLVFTKEAIAQLQQLAILGGKEGFNPLSEEEARADAQRFGPGVTLVSTTPIGDDTGQGRESIYAFTDINQLQVSQQPGIPEGTVRELDAASAESMTAKLTRQPTGNALLTLSVPEPAIPGTRSSGGSTRAPSQEQFAMVRQMFKGARVSVRVEPEGTLVATSSAYVDGPAVTLMDVNLDQLMADETLPDRMQAARTADEMKAILKDAPGLKINFDREITIEFTP
jgi:hypothetical protein